MRGRRKGIPNRVCRHCGKSHLLYANPCVESVEHNKKLGKVRAERRKVGIGRQKHRQWVKQRRAMARADPHRCDRCFFVRANLIVGPGGGKICVKCRELAQRHWRKESTRQTKRLARNKRVYGVDQAHYDRMLLAQGRKCAICGREEELVIDHDHKSKEIRGLLCNGCNSGLGYFREDIAALATAIAYVARKVGKMTIEINTKIEPDKNDALRHSNA